MGRDVRQVGSSRRLVLRTRILGLQCLVRMAQELGGLSEQLALDFVQRMQNDGRYIAELWS